MSGLIDDLKAAGPTDFSLMMPDAEVLVAAEAVDRFELFEIYGPALFARLVEVLRDGSESDRMQFLSALPLANPAFRKDFDPVGSDTALVRAVILEIFTSVGRLLAVTGDLAELLLQDRRRGKAVHYRRVPDATACSAVHHRFSYDLPYDSWLRDSQYKIFDSEDFERHLEDRIGRVARLVADISSGTAPSRGVMAGAGVMSSEGPLLWSEILSRTIDPMLGPLEAGRADRCLEGCGLVVLEHSGRTVSYKRVD